jgi:hypothetical protein
MTHQQIRQFMFESGFLFAANPRSVVDDSDYVHPSERWVLTKFFSAVDANNRALDVAAYRPEANDCDDFADRASRWAKDMHARMRVPGKGFAIGTFDYTVDGGGPHKAVFAIVASGDGRPKLLLIEPQPPCRVITLSTTEAQTCEKFSV